MADAKTETPVKRKRAAFTRTEKPVFAVINYSGTDANGQPVKLVKANLSIVLEKDAAAILEAVEAGTFGDAIFMKVDMPKAAPKPAAAPVADATA